MDDGAVTFLYDSGRKRRVEWNDPYFRITINRTNGVDDAISCGQPIQAVSGRLWLVDFLSDDEFKALTVRAKQMGLRVSEGPGPALRPGWTQVSITRDRRPVNGCRLQ